DAANTYDACAGTAAPEPEPTPTLTLTVTADATTVGITGPWWGWGTDGPVATDNGDGTWSVVFDPAPTDTMEYKWLLDGVQEDLVTPAAAGECTAEIDAGTINTDYSAWGNRYWTVGSGDRSETAGACAGTAAPEPEPEPEPTPEDGFQFTEAFSGAAIDGSVYTFPSSADSWAGFANMNTSLYPMTVAEDSVITFTGSVPAGGDAVVRFRFEANPYPNTEPSFNTETVTVSGADAATYSISVPSQGANTFNSFLLYLDTRDVGVSVTDTA
ncbi:MAG: hypothetical protein ACPGGC_06245, partial [Porticoccaceae bacterium]